MNSYETGSKEQVNFLKGLAILAVVTIHVVNNFYRLVQVNSLGFNFLVVLDQLSRYCVPLFITLSGFALAKKYEVKKFSWKEFLSKRLLKLLPLYFLWTLAYFLSGRIYSSSFDLGTPLQWAKIIFGGTGYYHLYFVPMIIQGYILFPVLHWLVKKYPKPVLTLSFIIQLWLYWCFSPLGWSDQTLYVMFSSWQVYFVLGIFLAGANIGKSVLYWLLAILGFGWTLFTVFFELNRGTDLIWATRFIKWPVLMYALGLIMVLFNLKMKLNAVNWLGKHSYLIYLCHVFFLQIIFQIIAGGNFSTPVMLTSALGIGALALSVKLKG